MVELNCLEKLQELTANNNRQENLREFIQLLKSWPRLKRLDCSRNPMCFKSRYRERVIVASKNLGKSIVDCFLLFVDLILISIESIQRNARW